MDTAHLPLHISNSAVIPRVFPRAPRLCAARAERSAADHVERRHIEPELKLCFSLEYPYAITSWVILLAARCWGAHRIPIALWNAYAADCSICDAICQINFNELTKAAIA